MKPQVLILILFLSSNAFIYSVNASEWLTTIDNTVSAMYYPRTVLINNTMWSFGGTTGGLRLNHVYRFNCLTTTWSIITSSFTGTPPSGRTGHSFVASLDEKWLVSFAGRNVAGDRMNEIVKIDVENLAWVSPTVNPDPVNGIPMNRTLPTAVVNRQGEMVVFGGSLGTSYYNDVWKYNIDTDTWKLISPSGPIPTGRSGHTAVTNSDRSKMIIYGGLDASSQNLNEILVYDLLTDSWVNVGTPNGEIASQSNDHTAVTTPDDIMLVFGGRVITAGWSNEVRRYNISSHTWLPTQIPIGTAPAPRDGCSGVYWPQENQFLIYGGGPGSTPYYRELLRYHYFIDDVTTTTTTSTFEAGLGPSTEDSNTSNKTSGKSNNTGLIVGVVVGVVALISISLLVVFFVVRSRHRRADAATEADMEREMRNQGSSSRSGGSNQKNSHGNSSQNQSVGSSNYAPIASKNTVDVLSKKQKEFADSWEILWDAIEIDAELGRGAFGVVYNGRWRNQGVAVKRIIGEFSHDEVVSFLAEAELMSQLRPHQNVVQFLGICSNPLAIICKYYQAGSLWSYLQKVNTMSYKQVVHILKDVAAGMVHLHYEKIVHRDLAARNILLDKQQNGALQAVVGDFGFARALKSSAEGVTKSSIGPVRWMAPESLKTQQYSNKSDSFAFGVLVWEMLTRKKPWADLDDVNVILSTLSGATLTIPPSCPERLSQLMSSCWHGIPEQRPTFQEIYDILDDMDKNQPDLDSINIPNKS